MMVSLVRKARKVLLDPLERTESKAHVGTQGNMERMESKGNEENADQRAQQASTVGLDQRDQRVHQELACRAHQAGKVPVVCLV